MRLLLVIAWLVATLTIQVQAVDPEGWKKLLEGYLRRDWLHATDDTDFVRQVGQLDSDWIETSNGLAAHRAKLAIDDYIKKLPDDLQETYKEVRYQKTSEASLESLRSSFQDLALNIDAQSADASQRQLLSNAKYLLVFAYLKTQKEAMEAGNAVGRREAVLDAFVKADDYINRRLWSSGRALAASYKLFNLAQHGRSRNVQATFRPDEKHFRILQAAIETTRMETWLDSDKFWAQSPDGGPKKYEQLVEMRRQAVNGELGSSEGPLATRFKQLVAAEKPTQLQKFGSEEQGALRALLPYFLNEAAKHRGDNIAPSELIKNIVQHTKPSKDVLERIVTSREAQTGKGKSIAAETGDAAFRDVVDHRQQPIYRSPLPTTSLHHQPYDDIHSYDAYHASQPYSSGHPPSPPPSTLGQLRDGTDDHLDPTSAPPVRPTDPHLVIPTLPTDDAPSSSLFSSWRSPDRRTRKSSRSSKASGSKGAWQGTGTEEMRDASRSKSRRHRGNSGSVPLRESGSTQSSRRRRPLVEETAESMPVWPDHRDAQSVSQGMAHPGPAAPPRGPDYPHQDYGAAGWPGYWDAYSHPAYGAPTHGAPPQYGSYPHPPPPSYGPHPGYPGYAPPSHAYPHQPYYAPNPYYNPHYPMEHYAPPPPPPFAHDDDRPDVRSPSDLYATSAYPSNDPAGPQAHPRPSSQQGSFKRTPYETDSDEDPATFRDS